MTDDQFSEAQSEVMDLKNIVTTINDALTCGESCEAAQDLRANLDDAIHETKILLEELLKLRKTVK